VWCCAPGGGSSSWSITAFQRRRTPSPAERTSSVSASKNRPAPVPGTGAGRVLLLLAADLTDSGGEAAPRLHSTLATENEPLVGESGGS